MITLRFDTDRFDPGPPGWEARAGVGRKDRRRGWRSMLAEDRGGEGHGGRTSAPARLRLHRPPPGHTWFGPGVLAAPAPDGGLVLLHIATGTYLGLDRAASRIVALLEEHGDVDGAARALAERFDVSLAVAQRDVTAVVASVRGLTAVRHGRARRPTLHGGMGELRRWWRLPPSRRWAATKVLAVVVCVELGLRLLPLDRLARYMGIPLDAAGESGRRSEAGNGSGTATTDAGGAGERGQLTAREELLWWAVRWVLARWTFDATCLRQALVFGWFLRRRHPVMRIGLLDDAGAVAHAWIVADDLVVNALPTVGTFRVVGHEVDPAVDPGADAG